MFLDAIGLGLWARPQSESEARGDVMTIKNIVIPLEMEYLQAAAKERGISRTKLVRVLMQKVVRDELVPKILCDEDLVNAEPRQERYRRFRAARSSIRKNPAPVP
jgi:hypothetical protein